jgi:hypothetical protein
MLAQRWLTFARGHAKELVACDFCVVVTATFRLLYVCVLRERATRRLLQHLLGPRDPRPGRYQCLCKNTGTGFQSTDASWPVESLAVCIMNIALRRPPDDATLVFADHRALFGM